MRASRGKTARSLILVLGGYINNLTLYNNITNCHSTLYTKRVKSRESFSYLSLPIHQGVGVVGVVGVVLLPPPLLSPHHTG